MIRPKAGQFPASVKFKLSWFLSGIVVVVVCNGGTKAQETPKPDGGKRPVAVRDVISMNRLGLPDALLSGQIGERAATFSPDGKRFVVVLKKGNIDHNTNDYSVQLYQASQAFRSPRPKVLFTLSSSSNREAVRDLKWLNDNDTLAFIGERVGEPPEVYRFSIANSRLDKVTTHRTPVVAFDASADGKTILFEADPAPRKSPGSGFSNAADIVISSQSILEVLAVDSAEFIPTKTQGESLFLIRDRKDEVEIPVDDVMYAGIPSILISPDGKYALIGGFARDVPAAWSEYKKDAPLQKALGSNIRRKGEAFRIPRYLLLETERLRIRPLFNTPMIFPNNDAVWADDGKAIFVSGVHLPLDNVEDAAEREARKEKTFVVEVELPGKEIIKVTDEDVRVKGWASGRLSLIRGNWWEREAEVIYEKQGSVWREIAADAHIHMNDTRIQVTMDEDANSPPKLYVVDPQTLRKALLLDLNPQFSELKFAKVEVVSWKATDGHEVQGGLFLPPSCGAEQRCPLVIQTHGFLTSKFYIDGPWSSAFAAQPLASRGIVVLQVGYSTAHDDSQYDNTPQEAPREMSAYEGAIDYLDKRGLIDRDRVGIIGFSRTVYKAAYTLTHSKYQFAAATFADGIDGGYYEYLLFHVGNDPLLNGGPPFGKTLSLWIQNAPEFSMDKVRTPIRLEAYSPPSALGIWNWFSGLSLQGKPVDFIYLPHGTHLLTKPAERMVSQQGNVDWFCFWLKREEDPDPAKAEQYARWRVLDELQRRTEKATYGPPALR